MKSPMIMENMNDLNQHFMPFKILFSLTNVTSVGHKDIPFAPYSTRSRPVSYCLQQLRHCHLWRWVSKHGWQEFKQVECTQTNCMYLNKLNVFKQVGCNVFKQIECIQTNWMYSNKLNVFKQIECIQTSWMFFTQEMMVLVSYME